MPALTTGMVVGIVGTDEIGTLIQVREASQTCVIKLNNGTLKKNVPLADVKEAKDKVDAKSAVKSPIRLVAGDGMAVSPSSPLGGRGGLSSPKSPPARLSSLSVETGSGARSVKGNQPWKVQVGDLVKARYKKGSKWFPGKITRVRTDGTFDVEYEDGDLESKVEIAFIELVAAKSASTKHREDTDDDDRGKSKRTSSPTHGSSMQSSRFQVGDLVKARYKKGSKWFPGKITRVHSDGSCDIRYEDGDSESKVEIACIELVAAAVENEKHKTQLQVGDAVTARYNKGSKWFSGAIARVRSDGTYDIKYDDGDTEARVAIDMIKPKHESDSSKKSPQKTHTKEFEVGDQVMARFKRSTKWFKGIISRARTNGTFDVEFEDGDIETQLDVSMLEKVEDDRAIKSPVHKSKKTSSAADEERATSSARKVAFGAGDVVRVRYKGGAKFFPAKITRERSDGSYDVRYDDGDVETHVDSSFIESPSKKNGDTPESSASARQRYEVGDIVQAKHKNGAKWFRGRITRSRSDGTYDIKYDDGDVETYVHTRCIQPEDSVSDSKEKSRGLQVGQGVNARYRKGSKWFPGKIIKVRLDDTFDVRYDDGDEELRVAAELIEPRAVQKEKTKESKAGNDDAFEDSDSKPSSRQKSSRGASRKGRFNKDKTSDSDMSDMSDSGGGPSKRRQKEKKKSYDSERSSLDSASDGHSSIQTGMRVTLRKAKDEKSRRIGIVKRTHSDRSCDVAYEDGSVAKRIAATLLLVCSASEESDSSESASKSKRRQGSREGESRVFRRNDKVLANWRRASRFSKPRTTSKWEPALVLARNSDDTYSIRYDRGDIEEDVPPDALKIRPSSNGTSSNGSNGKKHKARKGEKSRSSSNRSSNSSPKQASSQRPKIDSILSRLFEPALMKKYRRTFAEQDRGEKDKISRKKIISLVAELCATKTSAQDNSGDGFSVHRVLAEWFDSDDELRLHRRFGFKTMMLAFAYAKHRQSKLRIEQSVATVLDGRFASFHENKRQLELWQQKLGFRTFETLQRFFHDSALPNIIPSRVRVSEIAHMFDQVARNSAPNKPLEVYLQQLHLQPHNTLLLPEFLCCYYQLYGSSDNRTMASETLELRPVAFVASCFFSNGDIVCNRHGDLVRRLSVGRTPGQQELILRFREVFESLQPAESESDDLTIPTSQLSAFAAKVVHDPTMLESALALLRKRAATVSLVEIYASCGFVIDELTSAPTISNAIEKLRLRVEVAEVRRIVGLVRNVCLKILRFPNNSDYWRIRADSAAFQQKIGRFDGATKLLEAVGFIEYSKTHFELRGARIADGKRASALSKTTLDKLRERCVELDAELSLFDGVESISSILQRISKERERETPLTLDECQEALSNMSAYIENVLKNPKDSRCWRIREANKTFQRQIGYLPFSADLMESIGYELVQTSQGNVFALRGTGTLNPVETSKPASQASLSNFSFSRVSEQMEWFLWRRKQEIDALLEDEMQYLVDVVRTRSPFDAENKRSHLENGMTSQDAVVVKMYPYGKNAIDTFNKTSVQRKQIEMIKVAFDAIDLDQRGFLLEQDSAHVERDQHAPVWMRFDAFDIDKDGKVDFADFVAALGPLLDHSFDFKPTREQRSALVEDSLTLCEQVSLAVGRLRVGASLIEASTGLKTVLVLLHRIIQEPANQDLWFVREKSDLWSKLLRFHAGRELLRLCGFRELADTTGKPTTGAQTDDVVYALQAQKVRFVTSKSAPEPNHALDSGTFVRLQTVTAMLSGHCRGMKYPEISDVSAVSRAIALMPDSSGWMRLIELSVLCIGNILKHPDDAKFRHLQTSTQTYSKVVESVRGGTELMLSLGFRETDTGTLALPLEISAMNLTARKMELEVGLALLRAAHSTRQGNPIVLGSPQAVVQSSKIDRRDEEREIEYYKKKAVAAERARQEESKKSQHLARQLQLLAEARCGQNKRQLGKKTAGNQRGGNSFRPSSTSGRHTNLQSMSGVSSDSIEDEIRSELSPRVDKTDTQSTSFAGSKPDSKRHPYGAARTRAKTLQRRSPSVPSASSGRQLSLGMDVDAGSDEMFLLNNAAVQRGVALRIGAEVPDLVEERVVVAFSTNEAFAGLLKVQLSSSLRFFHAAKELVCIAPLQRQECAPMFEVGELETFLRNEVLDQVIAKATKDAQSLKCMAAFPQSPAKITECVFSHECIRALPLSASCSQVKICVDPYSHNVVVLLSPPKDSADVCEVRLLQDQVTDRKLQVWWDGVTMDYGVSNTKARLGDVRFVISRNAYFSLLSSLTTTASPLWSRGDDSTVGYEDLLDAFGLSSLLYDDLGESEDLSLLLPLAYLRKHFRVLSKKSTALRDGFKCVGVDELLDLVVCDLQANPPRISEDPRENQDELANAQAICRAVREALRREQRAAASWSELQYFVKHRTDIRAPETIPMENGQLPLALHRETEGGKSRCEASTKQASVAQVIVGRDSSCTIVLYFDGCVDIWTGRNQPKCILRSFVLLPLKPSTSSRQVPQTAASSKGELKSPEHDDFARDWIDETLNCAANPDRKQQQMQRTSAALHQFRRSFGDHATLLGLSCWDSILVVNTSFMDSGRCSGRSSLRCFRLTSTQLYPIHQIIIESVVVHRALDQGNARVRKETELASVGTVSTFDLVPDASSVVFVVGAHPLMVWVADAASGDVLGYVDDYIHCLPPSTRLVFQILASKTSDGQHPWQMCVATNSTADRMGLWEIPVCKAGKMNREAVFSLESSPKKLKHTLVESLSSSGDVLLLATRDGSVRVWSTDRLSSSRSSSSSLRPEASMKITDGDEELSTVLCTDASTTTTSACEGNLSSISIPSSTATDIEEWEASLGVDATRLVLYVFEDGEVVSAPVEAFDLRMATLDDVEFERRFFLTPCDYSMQLDRVVLQKQQLVRIGFFACQHLRSGVFTQRSMNEILRDLEKRRILWKAHTDFEKFAELYIENVDMDLRMVYRRNDSKDHEISPRTDDYGCGHLARPPDGYTKVVFALVKHIKTQEVQLRVWKLAREGLASSEAQLKREEFHPTSKAIRLGNAADALRLKSSYILEAARIHRAHREWFLEDAMQHLVQQRTTLVANMKAKMSEMCSEHDSIETIAEELLQSLHLVALLTVTANGENRPLEKFFHRMFKSIATDFAGDQQQDGGCGPMVDTTTFLRCLRNDRWRTNPFYRTWARHLSSAVQSPRLEGRDSISWNQVQHMLRSIQQTWMDFEMVATLCRDLGSAGESGSSGPASSEASAILARQLEEFFATTSEGKAVSGSLLDTLLSPQDIVEFLVEKNNFSMFFNRKLGHLSDRIRGVRETNVDGMAADEMYSLILSSSQWTHHIRRLELQQLELNSDGDDSHLLEPTLATTQRLKQLLKTPLPRSDTVADSILLKKPCDMARVRCRTIFEAEGKRRGQDSVVLSVVFVDCGTAAERQKFQQELAFYRIIQRWRARELFLPVCFSAMDVPIVDPCRDHVVAAEEDGGDMQQVLVTESLAGCISLGEWITYVSIPGLSLQYWAPVVSFWCRQVLLAAIAMRNQGFSLESIEFSSLVVTCEGRELRFASLDAGRFLECEQCDGSDHVRVFGEFLLRLIEAFSAGEDGISPSSAHKSPLFHPALEDELLRQKRKALLSHLQVEQSSEEKSPMPLSELSRVHDVLAYRTEDVDEDILRLHKIVLLALQERPHRPCLESLFGALLLDVPDHIPDGLSREMAALVWCQHTLHVKILGGLQYCAQSEGDVPMFGSLAAMWTEFAQRHCAFYTEPRAPPDQEKCGVNTRILEHLERVVLEKQVMRRYTDVGLEMFAALAARGDGSNGHKVVQHLLTVLDFNFRLLNASGGESLSEHPFLRALLLQSLVGLCRVSSGSEFASYSQTKHANEARLKLSTAFSVLWRLSETLWRDLLGIDAPSHYPSLLDFLKSYSAPLTTEEGDVFDVGYESVGSSHLAAATSTSSNAEVQVGLWWSDQCHALPRLEGCTTKKDREDPILLSFEYLQAFHRTLEVYFNLTSGIAVPKFRLAALHQWFAATFLERKACFPMVIVHSMVARVWKDIGFGDFLCKLLRDRDENVVLGAISLFECATRVFRFDGLEHSLLEHQNGSASKTSSVYRKRPRMHLFTANAVEFAKSLCSARVVSEVSHTLDRVVRLLKALGERGIGNRGSLSSSKPNVSASILCVILSFLTNCLHCGDCATQHWVSTDLARILLSHAKSNSLAFVDVVDSNALNGVFQQSKRLLQQREGSVWKVFTAVSSESSTKNSTRTSPFKLLLVEIVACAGHNNVLLIQNLLRSSFFRQEAAFLASKPPHPVPANGFVQQTDLIFSREYGKPSHACDLASDLRHCNGTLSEIAQLVAYTKALFLMQRAAQPSAKLSPRFLRVFAEIWRWMETTWQDFLTGCLRGGQANTALMRMQCKLLLSSISLLHQITIDRTLTLEELADLSTFPSSTPCDEQQEQESNAFQVVLSLLDATLNTWRAMEMGSTVSAAAQMHLLASVSACAMELFVNATRMRKYDGVAAAVLERCVDPASVLELLGREVCVAAPPAPSLFGIMDKQRLWASVLQLDSRFLTNRILEGGFFEHTVFALLHGEAVSKNRNDGLDHSHKAILEPRLEALMFLEVLVHLFQVLGHSVNFQLILSEVCKLFLVHQTVSKEAVLVRESRRLGGRHGSIAKRILQVICCICVDFSSLWVDRAFQERLEAVGIPMWVISFHQHSRHRHAAGDVCVSSVPAASELKRQYKLVHLFWKDWNGQPNEALKAPPIVLSKRAIATAHVHVASPPRHRAIKPPSSGFTTEARRSIVHFSDQVQRTTQEKVSPTRTRHTAKVRSDPPVHPRVPAASHPGPTTISNLHCQAKVRKSPLCFEIDATRMKPELAIVSPVNTRSMAQAQRFSFIDEAHSNANSRARGPEDLVQTLMSVDMESAQILLRQKTPTGPSAKCSAKEKRHGLEKKKSREHIAQGDDDESLGSEAYSPFALSSSSSSSEDDTQTRNMNAKSKPKKNKTREAKGRGQQEKKQMEASSEGSESSDIAHKSRRQRRASSSSSASSKASSSSSPGSDSAQERRVKSKKPSNSRSSPAAATRRASSPEVDPQTETLRRVFRKYDVDGDGAISFIDLRKALSANLATQQLSDVEIQKWITEKDRSGQGVVGFEDFRAAFGTDSAAAPSQRTSAPASQDLELLHQQRVVLSTNRRPASVAATNLKNVDGADKKSAHMKRLTQGSSRSNSSSGAAQSSRVGQGCRLGYAQEPKAKPTPPAMHGNEPKH